MPSTTFIRREIAAIERRGHRVDRYTVRRHTPLMDPLDHEEVSRTRCLLEAGTVRIFGATLIRALTAPRAFLRALKLALHCGRRSHLGAAYHLIYLAEACMLLHWLERDGAEHLHVHFGNNSAMVAMLCRELGGPPYSFTVHGPEEFDFAGTMSFEEKVARAKAAIAISGYGRSQLMRWAAWQDWPKIHIVRCGLDSSFLRQSNAPFPHAQRLVCVGRLCEQKGLLLLVEAAALLCAEGFRFDLTLIGEGPLRPQLEESVNRLGLSEVVKLPGAATEEQVRSSLLAARALVLPSFAEGLPVAIMESFALGRPVLTTQIAGIPELVEDGMNGWLITAGDVEAIAAGMRRVLTSSPADLERMGREGAQRVHERHDVDLIAVELEKIFQDQSEASSAHRDLRQTPRADDDSAKASS